MNPPKKCISMGGPSSSNIDYDPNTNQQAYNRLALNDYRLQVWNGDSGVYYRHNRNYAVASNSQWIKVWVSAYELMSWMDPADPASTSFNPPASQFDCWDRLNGFDNNQSGGRPPYTGSSAGRYPYMQRLDRQIRAINDDGYKVILTVFQSYPLWFWRNSSGGYDSYNTRLANPARGTAEVRRMVDPNQVTATNYWGWFIAHLIGRYSAGVAPNNPGPNANNGLGNPYGASIQALEVVNEPNYGLWPQNTIHSTASNMMGTAHDLAAFFTWAYRGQWIFGPGTLDYDGSSDLTKTHYATFTQNVLSNLRNFRPSVYVGWTQHNYRDVLNGDASRFNTVNSLLQSNNWRGGGDRYVWLTEGGYARTSDSASEQNRQSSLVTTNFNLMAPNAACPMYATHAILNAPVDTFRSGVRTAHYGMLTGVPHPSPDNTQIIDITTPYYTTWKNFPGAP